MRKRTAQRSQRLLLAALLLFACLPLQGCVVAAVGAGIGAMAYGKAQQQKAYTEYRNHTETLNLQREKAGLQPKPVLTFKEWNKGNQ